MKKYLALFMAILTLASVTAYSDISDSFVEDCKSIPDRKEVQDGIASFYNDTLRIGEMDDETILSLVAMLNAEFYYRGINKLPRCDEAMTPLYTYVQENLCGKSTSKNNSQDNGQVYANDYIRPEIKEAIDSYVDYFRSFADFMQSYEDGSNTDFMKYLEFLGEYLNMLSKFNAIKDTPDLTDAETTYFLNASIEIEKLLLNAAIN